MGGKGVPARQKHRFRRRGDQGRADILHRDHAMATKVRLRPPLPRLSPPTPSSPPVPVPTHGLALRRKMVMIVSLHRGPALEVNYAFFGHHGKPSGDVLLVSQMPRLSSRRPQSRGKPAARSPFRLVIRVDIIQAPRSSPQPAPTGQRVQNAFFAGVGHGKHPWSLSALAALGSTRC